MNLRYYLRGLGIGIIVTAVIMEVASGGKKETMSDAEIKARAEELGMVEEKVFLSELEEKQTSGPEETPVPAKDSAKEQSEALKETIKPAKESAKEPAVIPEETVKPTEKPVKEPEVTPEETVEPTKNPAKESAETTQEASKPAEASKKEAAETPQETVEPTKKPAKEPAETPEAEKKPVSGTVLIEVKSGDGSYTVCQKLKEAGLISSASEFDLYLYQNGYDKKLKIGTYEIPADAQEETIAEILAFG